MDFLGIGPLELVFILVIALIVLGPRDIARFARSAGKALNRIYRSDAWGAINKASREFRDLPNRLAREAALDELDESIRKAGTTNAESADPDSLSAWQPSPKKQGDTQAEREADQVPDQPAGASESGSSPTIETETEQDD